jgi:hypothetical protein
MVAARPEMKDQFEQNRQQSIEEARGIVETGQDLFACVDAIDEVGGTKAFAHQLLHECSAEIRQAVEGEGPKEPVSDKEQARQWTINKLSEALAEKLQHRLADHHEKERKAIEGRAAGEALSGGASMSQAASREVESAKQRMQRRARMIAEYLNQD